MAKKRVVQGDPARQVAAKAVVPPRAFESSGEERSDGSRGGGEAQATGALGHRFDDLPVPSAGRTESPTLLQAKWIDGLGLQGASAATIEGGVAEQRGGSVVQRVGLNNVLTTPHYKDGSHPKAKKNAEAADATGAISTKIYNKHNTKEHSGKCVSYFPTSSKDQTCVIVTYADLKYGVLRYDTTYYSKQPAAPEGSAITYKPPSPEIPYEADS